MTVLDMVEPQTEYCISKLQRAVKKFDRQTRFGTYIDLGRSTLIQDAARVGYDWYLFLDNDVVFTVDQVITLMRAFRPEMGAISGSYPYRDGSGRTTFGWQDESGEYLDDVAATEKALAHAENGDIVPVDKMPAGFLLMPHATVKALPAPAFATRWMQGEKDGKKVAHFVGEDVYLGELLKNKGFTPSGHFGIQVGHIGKLVLGLTGSRILTPLTGASIQ